MKPILLVGSGGHCRACIDVIEQNGCYEIVGIVDTNPSIGQSLMGYPIIGSDEDLPKLKQMCEYALITVGQIKDVSARVRLYQLLKQIGFKLPVVVSPLAYVGKDSSLGEGSIVMHGAIINCCARVGVNCIINSRALIEHDVTIGNHCHVSTAAVVNGGAQVQDKVFIGSQSVVVQGAVIAEQFFLRANGLYYEKNS